MGLGLLNPLCPLPEGASEGLKALYAGLQQWHEELSQGLVSRDFQGLSTETLVTIVGVLAHDLLDGDQHPDTAANPALRGALLVGTAAALWARFAKGDDGKYLKSGANDLEWDTPIDTKLGAVTDGTTTVAPCDKITFADGSGIDVVTADQGNDDALVTVGHKLGAEDFSWLVGDGDRVSLDTDGHIRSVKGWTA